MMSTKTKLGTTLTVFLALHATATAAQISSRALLGNWTGDSEFGAIEIAVWFSHDSAQNGYLRGVHIESRRELQLWPRRDTRYVARIHPVRARY